MAANLMKMPQGGSSSGWAAGGDAYSSPLRYGTGGGAGRNDRLSSFRGGEDQINIYGLRGTPNAFGKERDAYFSTNPIAPPGGQKVNERDWDSNSAWMKFADKRNMQYHLRPGPTSRFETYSVPSNTR